MVINEKTIEVLGVTIRETLWPPDNNEAVGNKLTEADWDAAPSSAKIRRRVDLPNSGRRPRGDNLQKTVSMLMAGLLVHPAREPADEHPLTDWRVGAACLLRRR